MGFNICENKKIKWILKFVKTKRVQMGSKICENKKIKWVLKFVKTQKSNGFLNL